MLSAATTAARSEQGLAQLGRSLPNALGRRRKFVTVGQVEKVERAELPDALRQ